MTIQRQARPMPPQEDFISILVSADLLPRNDRQVTDLFILVSEEFGGYGLFFTSSRAQMFVWGGKTDLSTS
jgi:hypothetical protein